MNCIQKTKLISLIIGVLITGSFQHITIPLFVGMFPSLYFLLVLTAVEGLILYTLLLTFVLIRSSEERTSGSYEQSSVSPEGGSFWIPAGTGFIIICVGVTNAIMSICFIYAANPQRTPVVIQSIFLGPAIHINTTTNARR